MQYLQRFRVVILGLCSDAHVTKIFDTEALVLTDFIKASSDSQCPLSNVANGSGNIEFPVLSTYLLNVQSHLFHWTNLTNVYVRVCLYTYLNFCPYVYIHRVKISEKKPTFQADQARVSVNIKATKYHLEETKFPRDRREIGPIKTCDRYYVPCTPLPSFSSLCAHIPA